MEETVQFELEEIIKRKDLKNAMELVRGVVVEEKGKPRPYGSY